ncbi:hypothetical protein GDI0496 [Gluconacetobacter diazotrophicus PA1 5]|uniref:Uncharacterized protein n=1 Tax=Gluconacetobacter diazotrophicus (strain ATCC 49037 / DSM 5601 / CCUG 37298 / CIP 103539 / LMG 7603 / PAl5) TaxID=272568 RepID=A9H6B9_GLUDA|nr:hypothetical protein GDI0496 [Gluconacetobacter diazotrophicus PA1 5]
MHIDDLKAELHEPFDALGGGFRTARRRRPGTVGLAQSRIGE